MFDQIRRMVHQLQVARQRAVEQREAEEAVAPPQDDTANVPHGASARTVGGPAGTPGANDGATPPPPPPHAASADPSAEPSEPVAGRQEHRRSPRDPGHHPVPLAVRDAADWSWRLLVITAAVAAVGWLAWELKVVIFPLVAAMLIAAGLHPLVRRLRRAGWGRGLAAATVFIAFLVVVAGSLTLVGNAVGDQFNDVVDQAEEGLQEIRDWLAGPPFSVDQVQLDEWIDRAIALVQDNDAVTEQAATAATVAVEIIVGIILALFALIFFLYDGDRIWAWLVNVLPARSRARAASAGDVAWRTLAQYVRGIVLIALFDAVFITILLAILRVPLAFPLGVLIFFGAFVPLVGAFVTGAVAMLVALVTQGLLTAIVVLIGIVAVQQIESNVFQPFILGRMVRVHPLGVVAAVSIGALAGGIIGAIVAVPIVAVVNTVARHLASTSAADVRS